MVKKTNISFVVQGDTALERAAKRTDRRKRDHSKFSSITENYVS